jgi:hypothetical protein
MRTVLDAFKDQRLAWSWAIVIGLFLTLWGHAPVLPVTLGCLLAVGIAVLRSLFGPAAKAVVRGGR